MIGSCSVSDEGLTAAERLTDYLACQSAQIDSAAFVGGLWHGLPGVLVSALLAIYVAGIGYQLLLGRRFDVAALLYSAVRVGFVVALSTSWSAYSTLIYDVSSNAPIELAAMAAAPTGLEIARPGVVAGRAREALEATFKVPGAPTTVALAPEGPVQAGFAAPAPPRAGDADTSQRIEPALDLGGAVFMFSCIGFSLSARLAQALLLAVGPVLIAAALFDVSTGLFIGWLRALATLVIAQAGYAVAVALELSFLESEVVRAGARQSAIASEPLFLGVLFTAVCVGITVVAVIASSGLTEFAGAQFRRWRRHGADEIRPNDAVSPWPSLGGDLAQTRTRALEIADAIHNTTRREAERFGSNSSALGRTSIAGADVSDPEAVGRRRGLDGPRSWQVSAGAMRRDARS